MVQSLFSTIRFYVPILILLLLSPASTPVVSAGNKLTSYSYEVSRNSTEFHLADRSETIEIVNPFFFLAAGILAGFNPCLLAVMAFLVTVILAQQGRRNEMLKITSGFSIGILTIHIFAGVGILSIVSLMPEIKGSFTEITIFLTALLGFWHIFDAYWLKKHARSTFKTPESLKKFMSRMNKRNVLLLSFLSGGLYFLVKAPCVGAVYLSILSILVTKTSITKGMVYMGLYILGLLLPIVTLGLLLSFGLSPKEVTEFREKWRVEIRLTTGIILVSFALLMQLRII
jgi:cytochrome c-type biogenesis protein